MTKAELIEKLARSRDLPPDMTKKAIGQVLDLAFGELSAYFEKSKVTRSTTPRFTFPGFGTFTKKKRSARKGVNPRTLEPMEIEACYTLDFKPAVGLKRGMNEPRTKQDVSKTKKPKKAAKKSKSSTTTTTTSRGRKLSNRRADAHSPVTPRRRLLTREEAELDAADADAQIAEAEALTLGESPMRRARATRRGSTSSGRGSGSKGRTG